MSALVPTAGADATGAVDPPGLLSLNGPDRVGKTTQLRRLQARPGVHALGSVHEHNRAPWEQAASGDFHTWWFHDVSTADLTRLLLESDLARAAARPRNTVGLLDRGRPMIMAVAAASCAVKERLPVPAALRVVDGIASTYPVHAETAVLLLPALDTEVSLRLSQERPGRKWTGMYPAYQRALHRVLLLQHEQGVYDGTVVVGRRSEADVAADIARHVQRVLNALPSDAAEGP